MTTKTLTPEQFLDAANLASPLDSWSTQAYAEEQYRKGLKLGAEATIVHVAVNDTWSAWMKDGAGLSSYEKLGYHAHTQALWRGVLDSGVAIKVHRLEWPAGTQIR
jgi:hypothetical protein